MPSIIDRYRDIHAGSKPRVLESIGTKGDRITIKPRLGGDFKVKRIGTGGSSELPFKDFEEGIVLLPAFREALPALAELYPASPKWSRVVETDLILPGKKRTDDFRRKWLQPIGANTAPVSYLKSDEFKRKQIAEQTAAGNLLIAQGDQSAEYPVHDRMFHLFGLLAEPQVTLQALQYVAQNIPDLAKRHPEAADVVRKSIAESFELSSNSSEINNRDLYIPSLDILNALVIWTDVNSMDQAGKTANNFVKSLLDERGFEVVRSTNLLSTTRETLPSGRFMHFVSHILQGEVSGLVVPREQELLVDYIPKLVRHLQLVPDPASEPEISRHEYSRLSRRRAA